MAQEAASINSFRLVTTVRRSGILSNVCVGTPLAREVDSLWQPTSAALSSLWAGSMHLRGSFSTAFGNVDGLRFNEGQYYVLAEGKASGIVVGARVVTTQQLQNFHQLG